MNKAINKINEQLNNICPNHAVIGMYTDKTSFLSATTNDEDFLPVCLLVLITQMDRTGMGISNIIGAFIAALAITYKDRVTTEEMTKIVIDAFKLAEAMTNQGVK